MGLWTSPEFDDHEQVCFFTDEATRLHAIVAIHSTALGPAAGGTRFCPYPNHAAALNDALRLSRAMSYKSALAGLPVGGGKAVIIGDPKQLKNRALLHSFARYIDRIGRTYATGEDVGMTVADIEIMNEVTPYVGGTSKGAGDPSIHTAVGLIHGFKAILQHRFKQNDFNGLRVAVQGLGAVGWGVAKRLHDLGAHLVVSDLRSEQVERAVAKLGAVAVAPDEIHEADVDIYAPCALGGAITLENAARIRAKAVAGAANNQLSSPEAGELLAARSILFAPDFVLNAGGIISGLEATTAMPGRSNAAFAPLEQSLAAIEPRLLAIFERADTDRTTPEAAAERMARELIGRPALH